MINQIEQSNLEEELKVDETFLLRPVVILERQYEEALGAFLQGGQESLDKAHAVYSCVSTVLEETLSKQNKEKWWQSLYLKCKIGITQVFYGQHKLESAVVCLEIAVKVL